MLQSGRWAFQESSKVIHGMFQTLPMDVQTLNLVLQKQGQVSYSEEEKIDGQTFLPATPTLIFHVIYYPADYTIDSETQIRILLQLLPVFVNCTGKFIISFSGLQTSM